MYTIQILRKCFTTRTLTTKSNRLKYIIVLIRLIYSLDFGVSWFNITELFVPHSMLIFGRIDVTNRWHSSILSPTTSYVTCFLKNIFFSLYLNSNLKIYIYLCKRTVTCCKCKIAKHIHGTYIVLSLRDFHNICTDIFI